MKTEPRSPHPDGDKSIWACPSCGSGEYLYNEDGNQNNFCGQCGQAIDWEDETPRKDLRVAFYYREGDREETEETDLETQRRQVVRDIKNGRFGPNCYILSPQEDPAVIKALRAYAAAVTTEDTELGMSLLATIRPLERPEECPFDRSAKALQHLFDTAWNLNTSPETRSQFTQMVTDQLSGIMQDFNFLVENWKLMTGFEEFPQDKGENET